MTLEPLVRVDSVTVGAEVAGMPAAEDLDVERVSLSQIKSGHIDDGDRPGSGGRQ
jgi:hypothetical protein